ncbi:hypothetical protein CgunFtcFv8_023372 [Champsocephalus gunnari]|uniref:Uncharacterized protein n=1 Tax=Champsocephalus gunnari TaxID=52237 RepID=A0AAN8DD60_CHAGU|nr:hypothetical protein CgunFtcFv8_023372 [Champsocephalus gunnari]
MNISPPSSHMPRRAWITEVRGLWGGGGAVGVWKADKGRQGQSQGSKLCPRAQTGGVDHDPLVWYDHLFVCLSDPGQHGVIECLRLTAPV